MSEDRNRGALDFQDVDKYLLQDFTFDTREPHAAIFERLVLS